MNELNDWDYALDNMRKKRRKNAEDFLNEVGYDFDVTQLSPRESIMYDFAKNEVDELVREHNQTLNNISKQQNPYLDTTDTTENYRVSENEVMNTQSDGDSTYQASKGFDKIYYSEFDENDNRSYKGIEDHEGGYSNRENDLGGKTNYGITQKTLDDYREWNSYLKKGKDFPKSVKKLNQEQSKQILDEMFYQRYAINKISNRDIVRTVLDECINQTVDAGKDLALAISELKGKKYFQNQVITDTLANTVNSLTKDETIKIKNRLSELRMERYFDSVDRYPKNVNNIRGWYNRVKSNHSQPLLFEKRYKKKVDYYISEKYHQYYNGK